MKPSETPSLHHYTTTPDLKHIHQLTLPEGTYQGELESSKKSGTGTFLWKNGDAYFGEWQRDKMHGKGIYCYSSGAYVEGNFSSNYVNGLSRISYPDGSFLKGTFRNGKPLGSIISFNSVKNAWFLQNHKATGEFDIMYEGKGKPLAYDYCVSIQGDALKDFGLLAKTNSDLKTLTQKMLGNVPSTCLGCFEVEAGTRHFGLMKEKQINGLGIRISEKAVEVGNYQNDKLSGFGQRIEFGKLVYKGYFINGVFNGQGVLYQWDAKTKYEGSFLLGRLVEKGHESFFMAEDLQDLYKQQEQPGPIETTTLAQLRIRDIHSAFTTYNTAQNSTDQASDYQITTIKEVIKIKEISREAIITTQELPAHDQLALETESSNPAINVKDLTSAMVKSPENIDKALDLSKVCINHLRQKLEDYKSFPPRHSRFSPSDGTAERPFARAFSIEVSSSRSQLPQRAKSRDAIMAAPDVILHYIDPSRDNRREDGTRLSKDLQTDCEMDTNRAKLNTIEVDSSEYERVLPTKNSTTSTEDLRISDAPNFGTLGLKGIPSYNYLQNNSSKSTKIPSNTSIPTEKDNLDHMTVPREFTSNQSTLDSQYPKYRNSGNELPSSLQELNPNISRIWNLHNSNFSTITVAHQFANTTNSPFLRKVNSEATPKKFHKTPNQSFQTNPSTIRKNSESERQLELSMRNLKTQPASGQPSVQGLSIRLAPGSFAQPSDTLPPTRKLRSNVPAFSSAKTKENLPGQKSQNNQASRTHMLHIKALKDCLTPSSAQIVKTEPYAKKQANKSVSYAKNPGKSPKEKGKFQIVNPLVLNEYVSSKSELASHFQSTSTLDTGKPGIGNLHVNFSLIERGEKGSVDALDNLQMWNQGTTSRSSLNRNESMNLSVNRLLRDPSKKFCEGVVGEGKKTSKQNTGLRISVERRLMSTGSVASIEVLAQHEHVSKDSQGSPLKAYVKGKFLEASRSVSKSSIASLSQQELDRIMGSKLREMERGGFHNPNVRNRANSKAKEMKNVVASFAGQTQKETTKTEPNSKGGYRSTSRPRKQSVSTKAQTPSVKENNSESKRVFVYEDRKDSVSSIHSKPGHSKGAKSMNSFQKAKAFSIAATDSTSSQQSIKLEFSETRRPTLTLSGTKQAPAAVVAGGGKANQALVRKPSVEYKNNYRAPYFILDLHEENKYDSVVSSSTGNKDLNPKTPTKTPMSSQRVSQRRPSEFTSSQIKGEPDMDSNSGRYPVKKTCDPLTDCHYFESLSENSLARCKSSSSCKSQCFAQGRTRSMGQLRDSWMTCSARSQAKDDAGKGGETQSMKYSSNPKNFCSGSEEEFEVKSSCYGSQPKELGNIGSQRGELVGVESVMTSGKEVFMKKEGGLESKSVSCFINSDQPMLSLWSSNQREIGDKELYGSQAEGTGYGNQQNTRKRQSSIKVEGNPTASVGNNAPVKSPWTIDESRVASNKARQQPMKDLVLSPTAYEQGASCHKKGKSTAGETVEKMRLDLAGKEQGTMKIFKFPQKKNVSSGLPEPVREEIQVSQGFVDGKGEGQESYLMEAKWTQDDLTIDPTPITYENDGDKGLEENTLGSLYGRMVSTTQFRASQPSEVEYEQEVSGEIEVPEERPRKFKGSQVSEEGFRLRQILTSEGDQDPVAVESGSSYEGRMVNSDAFCSRMLLGNLEESSIEHR